MSKRTFALQKLGTPPWSSTPRRNLLYRWLGAPDGASAYLDFTNMPFLPDDLISYSRASSRTVFNPDATLSTLGTNVPGLDYNPLTLQPRGLLLEGARTNSLRNSEAQGGVAGTLPTNWAINVSGGLSVTSLGNFTINGFTVHRFQLSGTTTGTSFSMRFENTAQIVAATGQIWASSLYARQFAGSQTNITSIDTEVQERDGAGAFLVAGSSTITVGTDLTRGSHVRTLANAGTLRVTNSFRLNFASGVAIDVTFDLCAPQLEQGPFASSYIPTTGAAATRAADNAIITDLASIGFNATEGTLICELELQGGAVGTVNGIVQFDDNTISNRISVNTFGGALGSRGLIITGGVNQAEPVAGNLTALTPAKIGFAFKENDYRSVLNGGTIVSDTLGTMPAGIVTMRFGVQTGTSNSLFGWLRKVSYYPVALPNTQLQALTA